MSTSTGRPTLSFPIPAAISLFGASSTNSTVAICWVLGDVRIPSWIVTLTALWFLLALLFSGIGMMNFMAFGFGGEERIRLNDWILSETATKSITVGCYLLPWFTLAGMLTLFLGRWH